MKQKIHYLFMLLLMIIVGAGGVKAQTISFDFEDTGAHRSDGNNSYSGTNTYQENNVTISCNYADIVTTGTPLGGKANILARVSKNSKNSPSVVFGEINNKNFEITGISYKVKAGSTTTYMTVSYSADNSNWITLQAKYKISNKEEEKSIENLSISDEKFYLKFSVTTESYKDSHRDVQIDDVIVTRNISGDLSPADLSFGETTSYTATLGKAFTAPKLSYAEGFDGNIEYLSSKESVATVDPTTGAVTLVGAGTTTITASSKATAEYAAGSASYTLTVVNPKNINSNYFVKVYSVDDLEDGDAIIIVNDNNKYKRVLGAQSDNKNNRIAAQLGHDPSNGVIDGPGVDAQRIILVPAVNNNWFLYTGDAGYLYAASSDNNYLKTKATVDNNSEAKITIDSDGNATIKFQGTNTRNWIRYNSSNELFSCYASGQNDVQIYKEVIRPVAQIGDNKYETFADAVAALTEENNTITLLANIEEAYTLAEGQTLNVIRGEYTLTVLAPDGNILQTAEADGVTTYSYAAPVAKIGETMYASLAEAVAAVPADGPETTITMLADASSDQITIPADKNIVIDFAGCTVTPTGKWLIINNGALTLNNTAEGAGGITSTYKGLVDNYGTLAVNSGTYSTTAEIAFWNNNENSTITVNSGSVSSSANVIVAENNSIVNVAGGTITATGEESYGVRSTSSKVNVSGGKVTAATEAIHLQESSTATISGDAVVEVTGEETWGIVVLSNSTLTVKDNATITSSGFAISGNGSEGEGGTTVNIEGGIVTGGSAGIYQPQSGNLNITGGTISGETGVYVKSGKLSVTGGAINGTGAKADYNFNGNGANPTGDALVIDNCGYPGGAPTASISGGTFTSINAAAVASYATTDNTAITKFVSGGTFSSAVPAEFCAEGYIPVDLGDGKYGVKLYISAPIIFHDAGEYEDALTVAIAGEGTIKYALNGETEKTYTYTAPFTISETTTVKAWTEQDGVKSDVVERTFTIVEKTYDGDTFDGYYTIKNNGNKMFVNVAGRKTVTFESETADKAGTVIRVKTNDKGQVEVLRSQGVDVPGYADKAMRYVPKIVQLVAEKLGAEGEGKLLGKDGLGKIMDKFNESFDYHLYLEKAGDGYRIYGRTPSMKPVVDFYAENKANVDAKLPQLEAFINSAIDKVLEKTGNRGQSILVDFDLHDVWQNMPGKLTEPTDESSTLKFYEEVLSSETNVWNFAYETAMIYWGNVKEHPKFEEYRNKLGDYAKYIDKVENIRPNFRYYIVQKDNKLDIISEGNGELNADFTAWTLIPRTDFSVAFNEENVLNNKYYTTLYTDFAYTLPEGEGVKAYKVTEVSKAGVAKKVEMEGTIPAQTPVLLESESAEAQTLLLSTEDGTAPTDNRLVGADALINQYPIKTAQVEALFDMAKNILGESFYNTYIQEYEHLMARNAGTVNNKYFFGLDDADLDLCVVNKDCVVRNLGTGDNQPLAFYGDWQAPKANQAFLVSEKPNPILLMLKGDVNRSGDVTVADVNALVEIVLGKVTEPDDTHDFDAAHVNADEDITIADVTALVNIILGKTQN